MNESLKMAQIAVKALDDKKGINIKAIDISKVSSVSDYFIIASGNSKSQVTTLIDNVEEFLGKEGYDAKQREGYVTGAWVLLDYSDIVVHVFDRESREFYNLERIWADGKEVNVDELLK